MKRVNVAFAIANHPYVLYAMIGFTIVKLDWVVNDQKIEVNRNLRQISKVKVDLHEKVIYLKLYASVRINPLGNKIKI